MKNMENENWVAYDKSGKNGVDPKWFENFEEAKKYASDRLLSTGKGNKGKNINHWVEVDSNGKEI